jgi:hypothetical protein
MKLKVSPFLIEYVKIKYNRDLCKDIDMLITEYKYKFPDKSMGYINYLVLCTLWNGKRV